MSLEDAGKATSALNLELIRELLRARRHGAPAGLPPRQLHFDLSDLAHGDAKALASQLAKLLERIRAGDRRLYAAVRGIEAVVAGDRLRSLSEAEIEQLISGDHGLASLASDLAPALERSSLAQLAVEVDLPALARLPLEELLQTAASEAESGVFSRLLLPAPLAPQGSLDDAGASAPRRRHREDPLEALARRGTGQGVVLGVIDFGCDLACPNFRHADGRTRLLSLWDQNAPAAVAEGSEVPYGRAYDAGEIDRALKGGRPYEALGYHPHDNYYLETVGHGAHGTAMLDLCAGSGRVYAEGGPRGLAPRADLVFVQVALERSADNRTVLPLGRVLDGIRYVFRQAGARPAVVNVSLNANGGPHDGATEFDEAVRALLQADEGAARAIVVAAGNFRGQGLHGRLAVSEGGEAGLLWRVDPRDPSQNDLEIWYGSAGGELDLGLRVAGSGPWLTVRPGEVKHLLRAPEAEGGETAAQAGVVVGLAVGSHVVPPPFANRQRGQDARFLAAVSLSPDAWAGLSDSGFDLELRLTPAAGGGGGPLVADLYLQRDDYLQHSQSRLVAPGACNAGTLGSLSCGGGTLVVGALDELGGPPRRFLPSSEGPTRDGRARPDAYAGGVGVPVLRSLALDWTMDTRCPARLITSCTSGTSAAAARISGALAARLSQSPRAGQAEIRDWIAAAGLGGQVEAGGREA